MSVVNLLEFVYSLRIVGILIGVKLQCKFSGGKKMFNFYAFSIRCDNLDNGEHCKFDGMAYL